MAWNLFQLDPNMSPQQVDTRRLLIANMLNQGRQADSVGEGLVALAGGIVGGINNRNLDKIETTNRQKATDAFNAAIGGWSPFAMGSDSLTGSAGGDTLGTFGGDQQAFIDAMMPHALRVSQQTGLDPRLVIAQAAQETGWGKHAPNNNYFGIKSHGQGGGATMGTTEYVNGAPIQTSDSFRAYGGMGQSADDYAAFLQSNPRYRDMLASPDLNSQVAALGRSGYATDPNYAASVGSIARGIDLPDGMPAGQPDMLTGGGGAPGPMTGQSGSDMLGGNTTAIYQALANPWLTQDQRQMLMMMLEQNDPLRQMQLREAQLRVQQMENPAPEAAPAGVQELEYRARQAGLEPGTPAWQQFMLTDGKPTQGVQFRIATPDEAASYGAKAGQFGPDGRFYPIEVPQGMVIESDGQGGFRMVQGDASMTGNMKPFTEGQSKDIGFATRAESALAALEPVADKLTERGDAALGWLPFGAGRGMQEPDYQLAEQAGRELLLAILRKDTGAAITAAEEATYADVYLPRPGDSPKLLERKRVARMAALEGLKAGMSPAQLLAQGQAIMKSDAVPAAPAAQGNVMRFDENGNLIQ